MLTSGKHDIIYSEAMKLNVVYKKLREITPYDKNAKKHDKTQIANVAESIKQYGFVQPIVIDSDGVIVIGHCRALAAKKLGMKEVPCVCVDDLTQEQVNALRLVDNKSNESSWDFDFLADELDELDLSDFDFDFGIGDEEENEINDEVHTTERELEPYKYIHYLVTIETNEHDRYVEIMKTIEGMGATVKMTRNDT